MIYKEFQDLKLSALGMGAMRLPVMDGAGLMSRLLLIWWITLLNRA